MPCWVMDAFGKSGLGRALKCLELLSVITSSNSMLLLLSQNSLYIHNSMEHAKSWAITLLVREVEERKIKENFQVVQFAKLKSPDTARHLLLTKLVFCYWNLGPHGYFSMYTGEATPHPTLLSILAHNKKKRNEKRTHCVSIGDITILSSQSNCSQTDVLPGGSWY